MSRLWLTYIRKVESRAVFCWSRIRNCHCTPIFKCFLNWGKTSQRNTLWFGDCLTRSAKFWLVGYCIQFKLTFKSQGVDCKNVQWWFVSKETNWSNNEVQCNTEQKACLTFNQNGKGILRLSTIASVTIFVNIHTVFRIVGSKKVLFL